MKSPVTRVFMVRHGATVLNAEDRFAGATDVALSDEGREQARRLAERLGQEKIAAVYASPMGRTIETAKILAAPHKLEVQARDGLREINHGRWEQMTRREVEQKFPEEAAEWEKDPYTFAPQGGESGLAVTARALPVLIDLVRQHSDENILVVSHKATIRQSRSKAGGAEHCRFSRRHSFPSDFVQRHVPLRQSWEGDSRNFGFAIVEMVEHAKRALNEP
jgi:broad specificity phosphatase PhoE